MSDAEVRIHVLDFETTDLAVPDAEIIEIGITPVIFDRAAKTTTIQETRSWLFKPLRGIPPVAMAVHHITNAMVADKPVITLSDLNGLLSGAQFVAAHNFAMEGQWLTPDLLGDIRPICTMKCARRIWPREAPAFSNQVLRYWRGLPVDEALAYPPHRAGPDTHVTAHLLADMLRTEMVRDLVLWTMAPIYYPTCPIGKWKDREWREIPADYLEWILRTVDMDADIKHAAKAELEFRRQGGA